MTKLLIDDETCVLVLTGAGVSAESGIATFRDSNGLWENHKVEDVASPDGFDRDANMVWKFYSQRRLAAAACKVNPGHVALADLERRMGDRFMLVTQNVDGLHTRAGNKNVVELHGNLFRSYCENGMCDLHAPFEDGAIHVATPTCPKCGSRIRPDIVWFTEMLRAENMKRVDDFIEFAKGKKFFFLSCGTSGVVYPAAGYVYEASAAGANTILVNAEPTGQTHFFQHFIQGKSGEILPSLLAE